MGVCGKVNKPNLHAIRQNTLKDIQAINKRIETLRQEGKDKAQKLAILDREIKAKDLNSKTT